MLKVIIYSKEVPIQRVYNFRHSQRLKEGSLSQSGIGKWESRWSQRDGRSQKRRVSEGRVIGKEEESGRQWEELEEDVMGCKGHRQEARIQRGRI